MTNWYRAGRRGLASGAAVDQSIVSPDDYPQIHVTSRLIVARAYAYQCDRVVYRVKPLDGTVPQLVDPVTGHATCAMAKIDGIEQAGDTPVQELWESVAACVWWDGSPMYTNDGFTNAPRGMSTSPISASLQKRFTTVRYLLPGQLRMLLSEDAVMEDGLPFTWLIG